LQPSSSFRARTSNWLMNNGSAGIRTTGNYSSFEQRRGLMPAISLDVLANTNPAFCSLVLRSFVEGYMRGEAEGLPLPHILLPLPIILSTDLTGFFAGTNTGTGLLTWIGRYPQVTIDLRERVQASALFSREALLFGITQRILDVNQRGNIVTDDEGL